MSLLGDAGSWAEIVGGSISLVVTLSYGYLFWASGWLGQMVDSARARGWGFKPKDERVSFDD